MLKRIYTFAKWAADHGHYWTRRAEGYLYKHILYNSLIDLWQRRWTQGDLGRMCFSKIPCSFEMHIL